MNEQGAERVELELVGLNDKRQTTTVFCRNYLGAFLLVQLIYKEKPTLIFQLGWDVTHAPKH